MSKYVIQRDIDKNSRNGILPLICLAFLLPMICAIIRYYLVRLSNGYVLCMLCYLCAALTIWQYIGKNYNFSYDFAFLIAFLVLYGLVVIVTNNHSLTYNLVFLIPIMVFSHISVDIENEEFRKTLIILSSVMFTITIIMSINILIQHPGASRVLASKEFAEYGYEQYVRQGLGGFDFIYAVTVLIPVGLHASLHAAKKIRLLSVCLTAIAIIMVLMSGYATAILLVVLGISLTMGTINKGMLGTVIVLSPLVIWLFLSYRMNIANYITELSQQFSSRAVSGHLLEIADIIAQKSDVGSLERVDHYRKSIEAFSSHPLLGAYMFSGASSVSGHSTILDLLGGGGLICTIPYIGYIVSWFIRILRRLKSSSSRFAWGISIIVFFVLICANPIFASPLIHLALFSIAVNMLIYFDHDDHSKRNISSRGSGNKYLK